jgi:hypothetical protein
MDSHLGDFEVPLGSRVSTSAQCSVTTKRGEALTELKRGLLSEGDEARETFICRPMGFTTDRCSTVVVVIH